jgi:ABC-type dipeptide/oligopeptide/nickel transport system permease subunit
MSAIAEPPAVATPLRRRRGERRLRGSLAVGVVLLALVVLIAVLGPILSRYGADQIVSSDSLAGPGSAHWLGADNFGRDVFTRVAEGYRISLLVALGSVAIGLAIGVPLGLLAGYSGDLVDNIVMRPLDVLMAFPAVLLAITVTAIFGAGMTVLILAIGVIYIPIIARVMRALRRGGPRPRCLPPPGARPPRAAQQPGPGDRAGLDPDGRGHAARGGDELHRAGRAAADSVAGADALRRP